jgi:hypothetical protein
MKTTLFALATLAVGTMALGIPVPARPIVNPAEPMVTVPGLEYMGASRVSSVHYCMNRTGATDWRNLITDGDLESMYRCLSDLT